MHSVTFTCYYANLCLRLLSLTVTGKCGTLNMGLPTDHVT